MADTPTTTIRLTFDLVGIGQDSAFTQTVLDELTSAVHSLAPDTLERFGISASTQRDLTEDERDLTGTSFDASRTAIEQWAADFVKRAAVEARRLSAKPGHVTSVTVALGASLSLAVSAGRPDAPDAVVLTLRAEGGTAIGVPTVAVDQLRAAGLVL